MAKFLPKWNGTNIFLEPDWQRSDALHLFTDASATFGYGAYFSDKCIQVNGQSGSSKNGHLLSFWSSYLYFSPCISGSLECFAKKNCFSLWQFGCGSGMGCFKVRVPGNPRAAGESGYDRGNVQLLFHNQTHPKTKQLHRWLTLAIWGPALSPTRTQRRLIPRAHPGNFSRTENCTPALSMTLERTFSLLRLAHIAVLTQKTYTSALRALKRFCARNLLPPLPSTTEAVQKFVAHLFQDWVAFSTIKFIYQPFQMFIRKIISRTLPLTPKFAIC